MKLDPASIGLLVAGTLFITFILLKLLGPLPRDEETADARRRVADAKRRARDRSHSPEQRAAALRDAAVAALEGLGRPGLAASYARRAERLDPLDPASVGLRAAALRRASRFRALERFLWRKLAEDEPGAAGYERAYEELLSLYDGPLRRPETAQALRRLRG
ncbi:MAG: hypothetical protein OEZ06_17175 [Myxococcales bacterium]|nr:hypothetical protein [Myxococcales bacterium]